MTALENARACAAVRPLPIEYMRRRAAEKVLAVPLLFRANTKKFLVCEVGETEVELLAADEPPR
jgi:hypothetical protein